MSGEPDTADAHAKRMSANPKSRKRMRIWFDESEEEEALGKASEESGGVIYGIASEQILLQAEKRGGTKDGITGTAVKGQRSADVVSMVLAPNSSKMSVHEKAYFSPYHSSQLLSKLADLWRMGKMCDATVCIGFTIRIKAHKLVLSSMSSVVMNMASKTDGAILELQLPGDLNVDSVQKFITYLYEGVLYLSATTVFDIQRLATMFKVDSVLGYCQTFLQTSNIPLTPAAGDPVQSCPMTSVSHTPLTPQPITNNPLPYQLVAPLNTGLNVTSNTTSLVGSLTKGSPGVNLLRNSLKQSSSDSVTFPKRPILRQQATVHGEEDIPQYHQNSRDQALITSKRVQELKGLLKKGSSETSDERSSPGLTGSDHMLGSPLETGSMKGTDSPCSSFDQPDLGQVKTEPDDSATESGDELNSSLPASVMFSVEGSEGMDPPDVPSLSKTRMRGTSSEQALGNSDPAQLTEQMRNVMPQTGILVESLPIPDGFLSESNPEQQRRYMASLLERTHTSAIPETERMYRCLFCPSSFVKAKSCVVHVIETHQVLAKDVLKYVSIERKGTNKAKGKCPLCEYKVSRNNDHLHYHKYFKHGIALPDGYQLYRCEICGKESSSKYNWRTHMDTCHFQGNTCEMCDQSFTSRDELAAHYRHDHILRRASPPKKRLRRLTKNVSAPADTSQSKLYVYKCPDCSYDTGSRADIGNHMINVHGRDMEIPQLQRVDSEVHLDKERLMRAQSSDVSQEKDRLLRTQVSDVGQDKEQLLRSPSYDVPERLDREHIRTDRGTKKTEALGRGEAEKTQNSEVLDRVKSVETDDGKEETGSVSNHSEYECDSPEHSQHMG